MPRATVLITSCLAVAACADVDPLPTSTWRSAVIWPGNCTLRGVVDIVMETNARERILLAEDGLTRHLYIATSTFSYSPIDEGVTVSDIIRSAAIKISGYQGVPVDGAHTLLHDATSPLDPASPVLGNPLNHVFGRIPNVATYPGAAPLTTSEYVELVNYLARTVQTWKRPVSDDPSQTEAVVVSNLAFSGVGPMPLAAVLATAGGVEQLVAIVTDPWTGEPAEVHRFSGPAWFDQSPSELFINTPPVAQLPRSVHTAELRTVRGSAKPVNVDAAAARYIGWAPEEVGLAMEPGLAFIDNGDPWLTGMPRAPAWSPASCTVFGGDQRMHLGIATAPPTTDIEPTALATGPGPKVACRECTTDVECQAAYGAGGARMQCVTDRVDQRRYCARTPGCHVFDPPADYGILTAHKAAWATLAQDPADPEALAVARATAVQLLAPTNPPRALCAIPIELLVLTSRPWFGDIVVAPGEWVGQMATTRVLDPDALDAGQLAPIEVASDAFVNAQVDCGTE